MFTIVLFGLITLFGIGSYAFAIRNVYRGNYRPNLFSRGVWFLLAVNTFASVLASHSSSSSLLLAGLLTGGSFLMFVFSIPGGRRHFGKLELVCSILLLISAFIWITYKAPLLNLSIGLLAHFIGAIPTFRQVWIRPISESKWFWLLFFLCSILSLVASWGQPLAKQIVPLYYTLLEGSMFILSMRRLKD